MPLGQLYQLNLTVDFGALNSGQADAYSTALCKELEGSHPVKRVKLHRCELAPKHASATIEDGSPSLDREGDQDA